MLSLVPLRIRYVNPFYTIYCTFSSCDPSSYTTAV
jgi:hypothetical protein